MTTILRPTEEATRLEDLPLVGALSIAQSIHEQLSLDARVRWPNDVFVGACKVAGVIVECQLKGSVEYALLGMGINANFNKGEFKDLQSTATTLMNLKRKAIDRVSLICTILLRLEQLLDLDSCTIL
jgi:BirA family biotin operon repressor/biotin-[acetyl-CoA-carboxylase] ligase